MNIIICEFLLDYTQSTNRISISCFESIPGQILSMVTLLTYKMAPVELILEFRNDTLNINTQVHKKRKKKFDFNGISTCPALFYTYRYIVCL